VAFEPVLLIEAPATGSNARLSTSLNLSWNDGRVVRAVFNVTDLGTRAAPTTEGVPRAGETPLTSEDRTRQTFAIAFGRLFPSQEPLDKHVYRIRVDLLDGAGNLIGQATTEVVFFK
jgi:hypothetical protein